MPAVPVPRELTSPLLYYSSQHLLGHERQAIHPGNEKYQEGRHHLLRVYYISFRVLLGHRVLPVALHLETDIVPDATTSTHVLAGPGTALRALLPHEPISRRLGRCTRVGSRSRPSRPLVYNRLLRHAPRPVRYLATLVCPERWPCYVGPARRTGPHEYYPLRRSASAQFAPQPAVHPPGVTGGVGL